MAVVTLASWVNKREVVWVAAAARPTTIMRQRRLISAETRNVSVKNRSKRQPHEPNGTPRNKSDGSQSTKKTNVIRRRFKRRMTKRWPRPPRLRRKLLMMTTER